MQHLLIKDALGATQIIRPHLQSTGLTKETTKEKMESLQLTYIKTESARSLHYGGKC